MHVWSPGTADLLGSCLGLLSLRALVLVELDTSAIDMSRQIHMVYERRAGSGDAVYDRFKKPNPARDDVIGGSLAPRELAAHIDTRHQQLRSPLVGLTTHLT